MIPNSEREQNEPYSTQTRTRNSVGFLQKEKHYDFSYFQVSSISNRFILIDSKKAKNISLSKYKPYWRKTVLQWSKGLRMLMSIHLKPSTNPMPTEEILWANLNKQSTIRWGWHVPPLLIKMIVTTAFKSCQQRKERLYCITCFVGLFGGFTKLIKNLLISMPGREEMAKGIQE